MSRRNPHPNIINVDDAVEILSAYGLRVEVFNYYQLRMWQEENGQMWDWFHTTGSLCGYRESMCHKRAVIKNAEDVAIFIQNYEHK